jgi:4-hydroxy-tetrahydrodipicolinate synthase
MMKGNASTFACVITPFDSDGNLDEEAMASHLARIGRAGVGVYLGSSSPGEGYSLSMAEVERLYEIGHDVLKGVVPVRAMGVEPRSAEELIKYVQLAERCDLDAMQLYCVDMGHSNQPSDSELERYFRDILEAMHIPALISSHIFGGYAIPVPTIEILLRDYPHLVGINCTNPDIKYVARVIEVARDRAEVHVGGPMQALSALALGGQGFLSSEANLVPGLCLAVVDGYSSEDFRATMESFDQLIRLHSVNQSTRGSARWTKAAMKVLGLPGWNFRPPMLPLKDFEVEQVAAELQTLELPELQELLDQVPPASLV